MVGVFDLTGLRPESVCFILSSSVAGPGRIKYVG